MIVIVDEAPGSTGAAVQVDAPSAGPGERQNVRVRADGVKSLARDGDGLGYVRLGVDV